MVQHAIIIHNTWNFWQIFVKLIENDSVYYD